MSSLEIMENNISAVSLLSNASVDGVKEKPKSTMNLNENSTAFIQLIGMPPPDLLDASHTLGPGLASSNEANALNLMAFPKLETDENASSKKIDLIDASSEDPFTLDTFESLINTHMDAGKDFIIARVLTMDEKDPENKKLFYSYYAAHQINRTLFRTQPEEGLLHRMKAKNPMNNLTIVGDVHYYVIKANQRVSLKPSVTFGGINKSMSMLMTKEITLQEMLMEDTVPTENDFIDDDAKSISSCSSAPAKMIGEFEPQEKQGHRRRRSQVDLSDLETTGEDEKRIKLYSATEIGTMPVSIEAIKTTVDQWKLDAKKRQEVQEDAKPSGSDVTTFTAHYYATDDDYLMRRYIREYFKKNALNPEDIFLFTLFGASQHNGESFSAPFVSDPTNPAAIAAPLDQAVAQYLQSLQPGFTVPNSLRNSSTTSVETETEDQTTMQRIYSFFANRVRSAFGGRHRYAHATPATTTTQTTMNSNSEVVAGDVESQARDPSNRSLGISITPSAIVRLMILIAAPSLVLLAAYLTRDPFILCVFIFGLFLFLMTCWRLTSYFQH